MGFREMMLKAKETARDNNFGDFILPDQSGKILIHSLTFFETDAGKWAALAGEIVTSTPKVAGAPVQPPGAAVRYMCICNGKYANIGYENLCKVVSAVYGTSTQEEYEDALGACFGADGLTTAATEAEKGGSMFAARGMLVGFSSSENAKKTEKRAAEGKGPITNVYFSAVDEKGGNSIEEIKARQAKIPAPK